ncbi:DEAD/DEAH box helicase family protein [Desulfonatronovibrio magnus]|uniref:DEAD/DEAH box helicase family protein n=1 Tax=Desulfonatronovibrio magnus TaxID=698827 RepID=UPI0005EB5251|nr:DEAD/DEAH box helicase family protein [Desulfonatronovibrio magnus]
MSNFAFLPGKFKAIADSACKAEGHILSDPRAACFHARFALEAATHWLYRHDNSLNMPYDQKLGALLHEPSFQNLLPEAVFQKARVILKMGNLAVHNPRPVSERDALQVVRELHHLCYWLCRTYSPDTGIDNVIWDMDIIPRPVDRAEVVPRKKLLELEEQLIQKNKDNLKQQKERDALDAQIQALRDELTVVKARAEQQTDPHDYTEAQTRHYLIDVELKRAGWSLDGPRDREYKLSGMPNPKGFGYADYVLWGDDGKPLAVVEAKKSTINPDTGKQQAKLYADCLENMHGQRPVIFYTNGYHTWIWDDLTYPSRQVTGFYKKDELTRLITRRKQRTSLDVSQIKEAIAGRYYQKRSIGSIFKQLAQGRRKALLVMATGTGKTRIAIALVDVLQRAGWVKRALFLADRVSLVRQAVNAFKAHLPESSPVNLISEKDGQGRVYVSTYPTMMGLIDETKGNTARFGVGHFDLVIIDEAHRSVYQKYGAIFRYFDSMLIGLTATPSEHVDRNTYELFDLEPGVPTDAYELSEAVRDDFLVPPRVQQVDLKFPREGISYESLTEEEKEQWESLDWGDDVDEHGLPTQVNASAINNWLFNKDTVDKVLKYLMQHGHKVEAGDRLAKTIIFARNHDHAVFIEERFNHHYPHLAGHFARVIDNRVNYAQSLIDDFANKDKTPHIAISVDMLDTGIDIPEVANLVFFKPVYSRIKFWQMMGRGTRLCIDLFGPGQDKENFRVFDFCFNFDFFRENPDGIEAGQGESLGARLFKSRVELLSHIQSMRDFPEQSKLRESLTKELSQEVAAMNLDNFIVRMHLQSVERFQRSGAWDKLSEDDKEVLLSEIAGLPSEKETDEIESRLFDLIALRMQLALSRGDNNSFEKDRRKVVETAMLLEEKANIPAVKTELAYLAALQDNGFWEGINLEILEDMRVRLRVLTPFLDKKTRKVVYTDFKDEIVNVVQEDFPDMPKMTSLQYEKKVREYLKNHQDHLVIHKLRSNQPLTPKDLEGLEKALVEIGEDEGQTLLSGLLERSQAPSLAHFIRSMVGLDRAAAQAVFSEFLRDHSLTSEQIRFIEMIIDQLTARGFMEGAALYEPPFSNLHSGGPDGLFAGKDNVVDGIFNALKDTQPRVLGMTA